jgi:hypothetical protein
VNTPARRGVYPPDFVIGEWRIGFSGRTQARAKQEGELPFFLDAPSKSSRRFIRAADTMIARLRETAR